MSMAGFVDPSVGPITNYSNLLQSLVDGLRKSADVSYFQLGTTQRAVSADPAIESGHSKFIRESLQTPFYNAQDISLETRLDLAFAEEFDGVTIIVSDLFQQGQAASELVEAARVNAFAAGYAAGILAVRSPFKGMVCDVLPPPSKRCFPYVSGPKSGRSVYLLAFGRQGDIERLLQGLASTLESRGVAEFQTLLVPRAIGSLEIGPPTELVALTPDTSAVPSQATRDIHGFRVNEGAGPVRIESRRPYSLTKLPLVPELDLTSAETRARLASGEGNELGGQASRLPLDRSVLAGTANGVGVWDMATNVLPYPSGEWRAIEFEVVLPASLAPRGALVLPAWISDWDLAPADLHQLVGGQLGGTAWSKTLRLKEFVVGLYEAAATERPWFALARIFYYLRIE